MNRLRAAVLTPPLASWSALLFMVAAGASILTGRVLTEGQISFRSLAAVAVSAALVGLGLVFPEQVLPILLVWLTLLGLLRRLTTDLSPAGQYDLLLIVGPVVLSTLVLAAAARGGFHRRTPLATAVLLLSALAVFGALNPAQGSLLAGITGLFFFLVPMVAFWIGRTISDSLLRRLLILLAALSIPCAGYGLFQVFSGFPSWDAKWIRQSGYAALGVYNNVTGAVATRPFSTFTSGIEYAHFLAIAILVMAAYVLKRRRFVLLAPIGLTLVALVYEASRTVVVAVVAAFVLMVLANRRIPLTGALIGAMAALLVLPVTLGFVAPSFGGTSTSVLVGHQVAGLQNPLHSEASTLPIHLALMKEGFTTAIHDPFGLGVSTVNLAGQRYSTHIRPTEADPSDVAVALGIPGLLLYTAIVFLAFRYAYGLSSERRDVTSLVTLGILTVTFLTWLSGGEYAIAWLPWLALGWVDRRSGSAESVMRGGDSLG